MKENALAKQNFNESFLDADDFKQAEDSLLKSLNKLDGIVSGTLESFSKLKKDLAEKQNSEQPLLSNLEIKNLQEENKRLEKEKQELKSKFEEEKKKGEKLSKVKDEVAAKIDGLISQLEKALA